MKKILLINGAARKKGTSQSMIDYLEKVFTEKGCKVSQAAVIEVLDQKMSLSDLLEKIKEAECIGIVAACYENTVTYPLIWCLEKLSTQGKELFKGKYLFAVGHGGMPYDDVHESCVNTCQCFAEKLEMKWLGGAVRGLTPMINGQSLDEAGKMGKKIEKGLDLLAQDVVEGRYISKKVQKSLDIFLPSIINPILVKVLNGIVAKDRAAKGVVDFDRKVY